MVIVVTGEAGEAVGLRQLRAELSRYVEAVKAGRSYTLTEHGRPVARLTPVAGRSAYEQLVAQGVIRPAVRPPTELEPPVVGRGAVSDLVAEQRR
ncbi:MAG: type II toxin-antitoxin system prevent-host-death family antitoxin [Propionibacteriaceae bacterium]|jgi:prevent-host-death family protein|nr:type II toxin-antitoxin system prevent-host-death family antitoxin [Propionibacteriaceae bacterium]